MGLDVYVGTLTRYYSGQWETAVQAMGKEPGKSITVVYPDGAPERPSPEDAEQAIVAWRSQLSDALEQSIKRPLSWPEGLEAPYFTDKPAWDAYGALLVWAALEQRPGEGLPLTAESWEKNQALAEVWQAPREARYPALLLDVELWLPGDETLVFRAGDPTGKEIGIAFTGALLRDLRELNERTWKATPADISRWRFAGAEFGGPFEVSAKFGFAVLCELAQSAVESTLPLKLDY